MSRYETDQEFFGPNHRAVTALDVWYWPGGMRRDNGNGAVPAKVIRGWQKGVADLSTLPDGDGTVIGKQGVYHISDERIWDHMGNLSGAAKARGVWEFTPWAWAYQKSEIRRVEKEIADKAAEAKKAEVAK